MPEFMKMTQWREIPGYPHYNISEFGDGNMDNNHFKNLRWATCADNHADKHGHGTAYRGYRQRNYKTTQSEGQSSEARAASV